MNAGEQRRSDGGTMNLSIENTVLKCRSCDKRFTNIRNLRNHEKAHEKIKCHLCSETILKSTLYHHMTLHTGLEKVYECQICSKVFAQKANLARHRTVHTGERPYKCDICSKGFTQKSNLYSHKTVHNGEKPFKCDICLKGFTQKSTLIFHKTVHTGVKPFKCDICGKGFQRRCLLVTHKALHMEGKIFQYDICRRVLPPQKPISCNQKLIPTGGGGGGGGGGGAGGGKSFKCDICFKAFVNKFTLDMHKTVHSGVKLFKCNVCFNKYFNLEEIKIHMMKHNGMTPHKCSECPKEFLNARLLKLHMHVHYQKFQCPICSKLFERLINIIEHMKKCKNFDAKGTNGGGLGNGSSSTKDNSIKVYLEPNNEKTRQKDRNIVYKKTSPPSSIECVGKTNFNNCVADKQMDTNTYTNIQQIEYMIGNCNIDLESQQLQEQQQQQQQQQQIHIKQEDDSEQQQQQQQQQQIHIKQEDDSELYQELLHMKPELDLIYNYVPPNTIKIKQEIDSDGDNDEDSAKYDTTANTIRLDLEQQPYELHSILDVIKSEPQ